MLSIGNYVVEFGMDEVVVTGIAVCVVFLAIYSFIYFAVQTELFGLLELLKRNKYAKRAPALFEQTFGFKHESADLEMVWNKLQKMAKSLNEIYIKKDNFAKQGTIKNEDKERQEEHTKIMLERNQMQDAFYSATNVALYFGFRVPKSFKAWGYLS